MKVLYKIVLLFSFVFSQSIQISVDNNQIEEGDLISLSIEAIGSKDFPKVDLSVLKLVDFLLRSGKRKKIIKIWSRRSVVFPSFVGLNFSVFNGKKFVVFCISKSMVGHKFGEFVGTKKTVVHKLKKK